MAEQPLRVAFDVTPQLAGRTGISRYVVEITAALERAGVRVDRFAFGRTADEVPAGIRRVPFPSRIAYAAWLRTGRLSACWLAPRADLVHGGAPALPRPPVPVVATVHDLDALDHPDLHDPRSVRTLAGLLRTLDRAAAVIAVSKVTAAGLEARGVAADRISVVHLGVSPLPAAVTIANARPYLLAVGELMPRKGFDLLIRAFARAALAGLERYELVIAGPPGIQADELRRLALRLGLGQAVTFAGAVTDGQLAGLYERAAALCMPSVAEGFGLPAIEAMAAGLPVVASDLAVLREVTGGHAAFVPAGDERAWTAALLRIAHDRSLRERLAAEGPPWAAAFTWERAAAQTIDVYRRVLVTAGASGGGSNPGSARRSRQGRRPAGGGPA